jgi:hypothetical protein
MPRYDIHIQLEDPTGQGPGNTFVFFDESGRSRAVRGPQKLANRWLMQFFRRKNTDPTNPDAGTEFIDAMGSSNLTSGADAQTAFMEFVDDCNDQVRAIDQRSPWLDADERLRTGEVILFNVTGVNKFEAWVRLTTVSGASVKALIPYARR